MKHFCIKTILIITILLVVIAYPSKIEAQNQLPPPPPPLSKSNVVVIDTSKSICPKDYENMGGETCCLEEQPAIDHFCTEPGSKINGIPCDSFNSSASGNTCTYNFGRAGTKTGSTVSMSNFNVSCSDALSISNINYTCSHDTWAAGIPPVHLKNCLGPGGFLWVGLDKKMCCPNFQDGPNNTKVFQYSFSLMDVPLDATDVTKANCPNVNVYNKLFKYSGNISYTPLTPKQICENDAKTEKDPQKQASIIKQCCSCISSTSGACQESWLTIDKDKENNTWTGIGCISRTQTGLATSIMRIFYGVGLVFLLIKIIQIGYMYQLGEPDQIKEARYGILAVILSFFVGTVGLIALRFVGLDVLGLGATTDIGTLLPTLAP